MKTATYPTREAAVAAAAKYQEDVTDAGCGVVTREIRDSAQLPEDIVGAIDVRVFSNVATQRQFEAATSQKQEDGIKTIDYWRYFFTDATPIPAPIEAERAPTCRLCGRELSTLEAQARDIPCLGCLHGIQNYVQEAARAIKAKPAPVDGEEETPQGAHGGRRPGAGRKSSWDIGGPTVRLRVPERIAVQVAELARQLDSGIPITASSGTNDEAVNAAKAALSAELLWLRDDRKRKARVTALTEALQALEHYQPTSGVVD